MALSDGMVSYSSETIYFESASFQVDTDSKGVSRLIGDIVLVNDALAPLSGGKFWIQVGGTRLPLRLYSGDASHPSDLGAVVLPSKSSADCHVYAVGFTKSMKLVARKTVGVTGLVAGNPVSFESDLK